MVFEVRDAIAAVGDLKWSLTVEQIETEHLAIIAKATAVLDAVATASPADFNSVLQPLINVDAELEAVTSSVTFLKDVSIDQEVRRASAAAQAALSAFEVKAGMRIDVFKALCIACQSIDVTTLPAELTRFIERSLRDYRRRGLNLPEPQRAEIEAIKTITADKCLTFQKDLGECDTKLFFTMEELGGMSTDFVEALDDAPPGAPGVPDDQSPRKTITLSYPHVVPILKQCRVPGTRAAVERAFNTRCVPGNVKLLEEIVTLRRYAAHILGYPSHSAFILEDRMAGSPATVESFLSRLQSDLKPLHESDLASLGMLKASEEGADSGSLTMSDYRYYQEQELATAGVDHDALKAYFPMDMVVDGMLTLYQQILSLRFEKVPSAVGGGPGLAETWHPDVSVYAVYDNSADLSPEAKAVGWRDREAAPGELMGVFYLDMHPRQGKYNHAAVFPLLSGSDTPNGKRIIPVAACVCNFTKPTAETPSLLRHEEAETFFHEFGHVMHHICSRTRTMRFSSFRCEADFVECPSQMLENWTWDKEPLSRMTGHYKDGSALPVDLADKLVATQKAHAGLMNTRQVFLAKLDFMLHSLPAIPPPRSYVGVAPADAIIDVPSDVDTAAMLKKLHEEILGIPWTDGTNFAASFGHLVGGYDSQYYGYLYSDVYAQDMFETVFRASGLTDPVAGYRYRSCILAAGGARNAMDSLVDFLGRQPNNAAFLRSKGLEVRA